MTKGCQGDSRFVIVTEPSRTTIAERLTGMRTPLHKYRAARYAALAAVAATLAWSTATVRAGDDDQRIQFAPGTDQGSVSGTFSEGAVDNFVLRAGAGQTMFVSVAPSRRRFGGRLRPQRHQDRRAPEPGAGFSVTLPASGDYTITVGPGRSEVSAYTLTVRIPAGTPPSIGAATHPLPHPARTTQPCRAVSPQARRRYVLRAAAGRTMAVSVGLDDFAALTTIFGPNGDVVGATSTPRPPPTCRRRRLRRRDRQHRQHLDLTMNVRIPAAGSSVQRIQFAPGTDNATVQGTFREGQSDRYVPRRRWTADDDPDQPARHRRQPRGVRPGRVPAARRPGRRDYQLPGRGRLHDRHRRWPGRLLADVFDEGDDSGIDAAHRVRRRDQPPRCAIRSARARPTPSSCAVPARRWPCRSTPPPTTPCSRCSRPTVQARHRSDAVVAGVADLG